MVVSPASPATRGCGSAPPARRHSGSRSAIRRLWDGETITEDGRFYRLKDCKLHSLADRRPSIWVSAFGPQAAEVAGRHGDGLWTLPDPDSTPEVIDAFRDARRKAGHDGDGEIVFQALVSWAPSDEEALEQARKWKGAQPPEHFTEDWHRPQEMYEHGEAEVTDEEFAQNIIAGSDPEACQERLRELEQLGGTVVTLQSNSGKHAERAIEVIGGEVLPALRGARV